MKFKLYERLIGQCFLHATLLFLFAGCSSTDRGMDPADTLRARFVLESNAADGYSAAVRLPVSQVQIALEAQAILSEFDYASIDAVDLELGKCLLFTLKPAAAREFYRITVGNQGKRLVLLINGEPMGARKIEGAIQDGRLYIFLEATDDKVAKLAKQLKETNLDIQKKLSR